MSTTRNLFIGLGTLAVLGAGVGYFVHEQSQHTISGVYRQNKSEQGRFVAQLSKGNSQRVFNSSGMVTLQGLGLAQSYPLFAGSKIRKIQGVNSLWLQKKGYITKQAQEYRIDGVPLSMWREGLISASQYATDLAGNDPAKLIAYAAPSTAPELFPVEEKVYANLSANPHWTVSIVAFPASYTPYSYLSLTKPTPKLRNAVASMTVPVVIDELRVIPTPASSQKWTEVALSQYGSVQINLIRYGNSWKWWVEKITIDPTN